MGDPVTLAESVGHDELFLGGFSASTTGIVAYRAARSPASRALWLDRTGSVSGSIAGSIVAPELSPDGRQLAFDRTVRGNRDVWLMDLVRGGLIRFTDHPAVDGYPVWSPDGSRIVFHSTRNGTFDLWIKESSGARAEALLLETLDNIWPLHWSPDGRYLLYQSSDLQDTYDLWALPMTGEDRTPLLVGNTPFAESMGQFSPDGRWVAYETDRSGRPEVVVQAFPDPGGSLPVSTAGGSGPRWRADGTEIYFVAPDGTMMAAPVTTTESTFEAGTPVALFSTQLLSQRFKVRYAVSRDEQFLVVTNTEADDAATSPITLLLNWRR